MQILLTLLLTAGALEAPLLPPAPPGPAPGTAWQRVQAAYLEATSPPAAEGKYYSPFQQFSAQDLRRALEQGIGLVREVQREGEEAAADRQVLENVRIALECYPLVAETETDLTVFFDHLDSQRYDPVYREFLLRRLAPGLAPKSLFADYLASGARQHQGRIVALLRRLPFSSVEPDALKIAAVETWYRVTLDKLVQALRRDQVLAGKIQEDSLPDPALLAPASLAQLSAATRRNVQRMDGEFVELARGLARLHAPESGASEPVRQRALEILKQLRIQAPLRNPEEVDKLISAAE